jgi:2-polyprenyl-6-hydroxyphenyl methylase/3-demethylubiquinone-9 3-methyltransferase
MWQALANIKPLVDKRGLLVLALYNDQGRMSRVWLRVKRLFNRAPKPLRWFIVLPALIQLWGPTVFRDSLRGRPFASWKNYSTNSVRGMSPWFDLLDWVGGLPFEVAKPEELLKHYREHNFELIALTTCAGGIGCNEYVFSAKN